MSDSTKGMLCGFLGNFIFGLSFLFSVSAFEAVSGILSGKDVFFGSDVAVVLALRFIVAALMMTLIIPVFKIKIDLKGKPIYKLIVLSLIQPVLYFIGENFGLKFTGIIVSSVMIALIPVFSLLFSSLILKERSTPAQFVFGLVSVLSVAVLTVINSGDSQKTYVGGIILLCIAVISAVAFGLLCRKVSETFSPFEITYFMSIVSAVIFTVYALISVKFNAELLILPFKSVRFNVSIFYLGLMSSVVAFFLTNVSKKYLSVTRAAIFSNVITVVSTTAGFMRGEKFSITSLVLCLIIVLGVVGVQYFSYERKTSKNR